MKYRALLILPFILFACSEDEPVNDSASADSLEQYVTESSLQVSIGAFDILTGNHHSFEDETDNNPVLVRLDAPDSAYDFRLYMNDSLRFQDSLRTFQLIETVVESRGVFHQFRLRNIRRDRYLRATYRVGDSIRMSEAITLRNGSLQTSDLGDITIEETEDRLNFSWESITGTDLYLVSIKDAFGDDVSSIYTYRNSFPFYDLRFATRNVISGVNDPHLGAETPYEIEVLAISKRGWMLALGTKNFSLEHEH